MDETIDITGGLAFEGVPPGPPGKAGVEMERVIGDDEAQRMVEKQYRAQWRLSA
jgi:hypothetical protein